ncbi:acyl carrier protein [Chryseobacterium sp. MEBOG06]|uniref:acyl carrier protein n=1 Tax=unclassified Chryseobacterium TaxID=2593645 RepID=UPI001F1F8947|nr:MULTISPECIES: acyl carrier protein [unclassified Chryseobacterium]UKB83003.1 acyl carrier protein [Chryseobacterium sp. MEBOG06]
MNIADFTSQLQEELELEIDLTPETDLSQLEEWDSMAAMILIGFVSDNFGVLLNGDDIAKITTVNSLVEKIGEDKFD